MKILPLILLLAFAGCKVNAQIEKPGKSYFYRYDDSGRLVEIDSSGWSEYMPGGMTLGKPDTTTHYKWITLKSYSDYELLKLEYKNLSDDYDSLKKRYIEHLNEDTRWKLKILKQLNKTHETH